MNPPRRDRRRYRPEVSPLEGRLLLAGQKVAYVVSGLGGLDYPLDVVANLQAQGFTVHTPYWNSTNPSADNPPAGQSPPFHYTDSNPGGGGNPVVKYLFGFIPVSASVTGDLGSPNTPDQFVAAVVSDLEANYHAGDTIVLIGHGLGASSVLSVANRVAADRMAGMTQVQVALLGLLDESGYLNASINPSILNGLGDGSYLQAEGAIIPVAISFVDGNGGKPINDDGNIPLFRAGMPTPATGAATYIYNRWQTNVPDPLDFTSNGTLANLSTGPVDVSHDFGIADQKVANSTGSHAVSVLDALFGAGGATLSDYLNNAPTTVAEEPNFPRDPTIESDLEKIVAGLTPKTLQLSSSAASVNATAGQVTLTVDRLGGSQGTDTIGYATSDLTAAAGVDYAATSGSLTFAPGVTSRTITIPLGKASGTIGTRSFTLSLSGPAGLATLGAIDSETVNIQTTTLPATQLAFSSPPPASVVANATFGLTVTALDVTGKAASSFNGPITLSLSTNPGGATLHGLLTVNAVNGIATFAGLTLDRLGRGSTLLASCSGVSGATTGPVSVIDPVSNDFDGSGRSELAVYLPAIGAFVYRPVVGGDRFIFVGMAGVGNSIPAPGDYDGSGHTEFAVYMPTIGAFAYIPAGGGAQKRVPFGTPGLGNSIPAPGDYDGSGHTEFAVYLPAIGALAYRPFNGGSDQMVLFGTPGFGNSIPAPGDYDGSGHTEVAVYLPLPGAFAYRPAGGGPDRIILFGKPGYGNSIPAPGDYDGSGRTELAVYLPDLGAFAYRPAGGGQDKIVAFGIPGGMNDIPVLGDYDGTGQTEIAVFLPRLGAFAYRPSAKGKSDQIIYFGNATYGQSIPVTTVVDWPLY